MQVVRGGVITAMVLIFFIPSMNARRANTHNEWLQWAEQCHLNGLDATMRGLSKAETKKLFDTRGKRFLKGRKSIRPIEVIIKNETDEEITAGVSDILTTIKFSAPLRDVSCIINAPRRSFPRALAFGLLGAVGAGVCIGYAAYIVGSLYFFVALGEDVLGSMLMGGITAGYVCLPVVPTAGYLVGSRYSIVDDKHYVITDITQPITIEAGKTVQAYVFVDAKTLC